MPKFILLPVAATFTEVIGKIDVSWRGKVVAGRERRRQVAKSLVG
jgi:hypothetical protein